MKFFDEYKRNGFIKIQKANFGQIFRQMTRARKDVALSKNIIENDPEWAATIAYHAMLRAGRALIFSHNYLPADGQQHKTVVELTGLLVGNEFGDLINNFNRLRKKRNMFFYDSDESCTYTEAEKFIVVAEKLLTIIEKEIKKLSPQFELKF
ncbi:MAG: HEPN domain-containing protein [Deltaproteobacteria bacterium]|nr:HEPN domain-containing protein [Deltaproteobacteria bacterium]